MNLANIIGKLRSDFKLSQEELASILGVTRQAVQKWENGTSKPDLENIIKLSKHFNISVDTLLFDSNLRETEELVYSKKISPNYEVLHMWEDYTADLPIEYRQSCEEGLDVGQYKELFEAVSKMPKGEQKTKMADVLFDIILNAKTIGNFPYIEPSSLEEIKAERKTYPIANKNLSDIELKNKIHGAWMGRVCGCMLGKTVECIRLDEFIPFLKETDNYPMHRYILESDITEEISEKYNFRFSNRMYADTVKCMPVDDDTNYTVLSQIIIENYGKDFTPDDVAHAWLTYQGKNAYCTAERVAFRNFVSGYTPPSSAIYKNPYREWIGAQIRGDYFGYINPGNPEKAAEMAWRDASISHIKNGIYGEMFIAAMLACAAVNDNIIDIINGGLAEIPQKSRLYEAVTKQLEDFKNGVSKKDAFGKIYSTYNDKSQHDWCHTISNALIVTASLIYGEGDFGKSICMAVEAGFDTDCNGATVGSIIGMRNGIDSIGEEWTKPINKTVETSIFGIQYSDIEEFTEKALKQIKE